MFLKTHKEKQKIGEGIRDLTIICKELEGVEANPNLESCARKEKMRKLGAFGFCL